VTAATLASHTILEVAAHRTILLIPEDSAVLLLNEGTSGPHHEHLTGQRRLQEDRLMDVGGELGLPPGVHPDLDGLVLRMEQGALLRIVEGPEKPDVNGEGSRLFLIHTHGLLHRRPHIVDPLHEEAGRHRIFKRPIRDGVLTAEDP